MINKYIELLVEALELFYQNDAESLFAGRLAHEQTMVNCIARYIWRLMEREKSLGLVEDVDVEYDKIHSKDPKAFYGIVDHKKSCCKNIYEFCGGVITDKINERDSKCKQCEKQDSCKRRDNKYRFRPDLILHTRNSDENWLVVEFKKMDDNVEKRESEFKFDIAKLRACTCKQRNFKYEIGAFVILDKECSHVKIFIDSIKKESFGVDKDGRHEYSKENKEPCYISK